MPVAPAKAGTFITRASPAYRRAGMALFLAGFATFSLLYCVQPLLPVLSRQFGIGAAASSLSLSLSTGALAIAILVAAALSERAGRRELMAMSMVVSALLNIAAAWAPTWPLLLLARMAEGFALGGVPAVAMTYLAEEIHPRELGLAMGLYVSGTAFGGMIGRVGTGILTDALSWRPAMAIVGAAGLIAALGFLALLPPSRNFTRRHGLGARHHFDAWGRHLHDPALPALYGVGFAVMGTFVTIFNYAGYRLMAPPYDLDQTRLGLLFSVYVFGIASSSIAGGLSDRMGRGRVMTAGIAIMAAGILLTLAGALPAIVAGIVLLTVGFFTTHAVASGWVGRLALADRGHATSLYLLAYYLGSSIAGSVGGWWWSGLGWNGVAAFTLILLAGALGAALRLRRLPRATGGIRADRPGRVPRRPSGAGARRHARVERRTSGDIPG
ncbi:major facilitator superfamily MFS_1 [Gluconacetobacter diazotrophicus PA1 5]|uniref:MFS transporter n=2 Tax=Gluconacetobacter diazotrophicus TaxID=33996 RepID=UPI000173AF36|nr:MFS transporter [Gluconacetobacter diazotrophicus]ACI50560.1 major facilitator superfamily MFS_1 [Gluconacetobacter diazotrophicus PA1 5]TWB09392.1 YNFM family putative membrane transporter [Gluconacetobacter diazotrophicus]